jgi:hypothetical protein
MASLCFYDAAVKRKENKITEDIYLQSIAAHCTGLRHGKNGLCNNDAENDNGGSSFIDFTFFASNLRVADPIDRFVGKMAF